MNMHIINLCISVLLILYFITKLFKLLKEYLNLKRIINVTNISYEEYIKNKDILDEIINEIFSMYVVINYEYIENLYIKEEEQKTMIKDIAEEVISKLSPDLVERISLVYNKEKIPEIISQKIYMMVTDYVISKNSIKNKDEE